MSCKTTSTSLQAKSFRDVMVTIVLALREKIATAIERRRIRTALNKLDEYMLKDMGIARSDIDRIAQSRPPH